MPQKELEQKLRYSASPILLCSIVQRSEGSKGVSTQYILTRSVCIVGLPRFHYLNAFALFVI